MLRLEAILDSYGFKEGKWKVNGSLIETEKGLKRMTLWTEESLLRWHILWRDQLAEQTGCLTNRMIQTARGEKMALTDAGWITMHDEVTTVFSYQNKEKEMGEFFGKYFSVVLEESDIEVKNEIFEEEKIISFKRPSFIGKTSKDSYFLEGMRRESVLRFKKAMRMKSNVQQGKAPCVAPIVALNQGKIVFEKLYWETKSIQPVRGYGSLRSLISEWLMKNGEESLFALLDEMDKYYPIKEQGMNVLADCLLPWEYLEFIKEINQIDYQSGLDVQKESLTFKWNNSRALVKSLSQWLNVKREKVKV